MFLDLNMKFLASCPSCGLLRYMCSRNSKIISNMCHCDKLAMTNANSFLLFLAASRQVETHLYQLDNCNKTDIRDILVYLSIYGTVIPSLVLTQMDTIHP